jgi:hypothetical protein
VVDDHSTDGTGTYLSENVGEEEATVLTSRGRRSAAAARKTGLEQASGTWTLLLDVDTLVSRRLLSQFFKQDLNEDTAWIFPKLGDGESSDTWRLRTNLPQVEEADPDKLLAHARSSPHLSDHRLSWADPSFDQHRAPWVGFWTGAVAASTEALRSASPEASYSGKGSEDLVMGLNLFEAGYRFRFAEVLPLLHLPHPRDRRAEITKNREHERLLQKQRPRLDVECLRAFGGDAVHDALSALSPLADRSLLPDWPDSTLPFDLPGRPSKTLLLGAGASPVRHMVEAGLIADPSLMPDPDTGRFALFGLALPFGDGALDTVVVPDLRGRLPEAALCRIFQEAARVADTVWFVKNAHTSHPPSVRARAWQSFDRPYWETVFRVSRSYFDWKVEPVSQTGSLCLCRVTTNFDMHPIPPSKRIHESAGEPRH